MKNIKYMITSGFLGAGKTTTMIALSKEMEKRALSAAVLANDLGAKNNVDADYTAMEGILTAQVSGDCICYQHEELIEKLRRLSGIGADIVFSDIPGCGIGALDHVYLEIKRRNEDEEIELLPFTCVADPKRLKMIMPESKDMNLPEEMKFLVDAQMKEADLIFLNKTDLLSDAEQSFCMDFLRKNYPDTPVFPISALTGDGVGEAADYILSHPSEATYREIGYGSEKFLAAEEKLSWYNQRIFMEEKDGKNVDFNQVLEDIFEGIRDGLKMEHGNVPHLKAFAVGEGKDYVKASLLGVDYSIEFSRRLEQEYTAISCMINARAATDAERMQAIADDVFEFILQKYNLRGRTFFMETFGMTEEGKENGGRASRYD
ncbi:MAG: GTPase (G3E family) [Eubacterium sp.]|nr:GTPase (G3E family) [Eubacterium sp.]